MSVSSDIDDIICGTIEHVATSSILDIASAAFLHSTRLTLVKRAYPLLPMPGGESVVVIEMASTPDVRSLARVLIEGQRAALIEHYEAATCTSFDHHLLGWSLIEQHLDGQDELLRLSEVREAKSAAHHVCVHIVESLCAGLDLDASRSEHREVLAHMLAAH